jgi:hypothetical protein
VVFVNLLMMGGLFEVCLLGTIIPAHAVCQFLFMEVANVAIFNWTGVSIILFEIILLRISAIASNWKHKCTPRHKRGCWPIVRCATNAWKALHQGTVYKRCVHCWATAAIVPFMGNLLPQNAPFMRMTAISSLLSQWACGAWLRMTSVLLLIQSSIGISIAVSDPSFALQHIMFCLGANTCSSSDHRYDSDSFIIAVDNCSSKCITNSMQDYISLLEKVSIAVKGIGGMVTASYKGIKAWTVKDDQGRQHTWTIPDVYFNKASPFRLLSPQHWAQTQGDNYPKPRGTWCTTYENCGELFWKQNSFMRTAPLSPSSNVALIRTAGPSVSFLLCSYRQQNSQPA